MSTATTPAVNFNKRAVEQQFHKHWNCQFDIELCDNVIYVHNDLHLEIEIPYSSVSEKSDIYNSLALLATRFDFSYTLAFNSLESLNQWHDGYNQQQSARKKTMGNVA